MTNKQLNTIRDRVETAHRNPGCCSTRVANDLRALLDEVERLTNDLAMARQVSGELCEACGWAMKFPGEPCRCELVKEVKRLTADPLPAAAWVREVERAAFARGAEACGWAMKFPGEPCRCELVKEAERLTAEVDVLRGTFCEEECEVDGETMTRDRCGVCRKCAYRRGAEAMREEIALLFDGGANVAGLATLPAWRDFIRELAISEDKP